MSFSSDIAATMRRYQLDIEDATARSLLSLTNDVVIATPKDSGVAQANWFPSADSMTDGFDLERTDLVSRSSINSAISESIGGTYWLTNNLPYIRKLEYDGHSEQAPNGMVRIAIANFGNTLRNAVNTTT